MGALAKKRASTGLCISKKKGFNRGVSAKNMLQQECISKKWGFNNWFEGPGRVWKETPDLISSKNDFMVPSSDQQIKGDD